MKRARILVTGPIESLSEYAAAARSAGWKAIELPLLRIEPHALDPTRMTGSRFDWICITSSNALAFLEEALRASMHLRDVRCAVVGERSAARIEALGLPLAFDPATDAASLGDRVLAAAKKGERVFWPRGSVSDDLALRLRAGGLEVVDPVAYTTHAIERANPPPQTEAVFFASPSAVHAWCARSATANSSRTPESEQASQPRVRTAIAIGRTTFDALVSETEDLFFDTISLPEPTPRALEQVLAHLDVSL